MSTVGYDYLHDVEIRVTDAGTGGQKGVKASQMGALDPVSLIVLSRVAGIGAMKYAAFNFLKGYDWAFSYNAAHRHLNLFWAGEDIDVCTVHGAGEHAYVFGKSKEEDCDGTNLPHPALAAWHGLTLTSFLLRGIGVDSRPPRLSVAPSPVSDFLDRMVEREPGTSGFLAEDDDPSDGGRVEVKVIRNFSEFVQAPPDGYCPDCGQPILSHSHLITCPACPAYGS